MSELEKYKLSFKDSLSLKDEDVNEKLEYNGVQNGIDRTYDSYVKT